MAAHYPTFSSIAAELQVMILAKFFEGTVINVEYPHQTMRKVPYADMKLQGSLQVFFVSKTFYEASKAALFQTATFHHRHDLYLGKGQKRSNRLRGADPEAVRHLRHISGPAAWGDIGVDFMQQCLILCNSDRWPFEDLRILTIKPDSVITYHVPGHTSCQVI